MEVATLNLQLLKFLQIDQSLVPCGGMCDIKLIEVIKEAKLQSYVKTKLQTLIHTLF